MSHKILLAIMSWLAILSLPAVAAGGKLTGTVPFSGDISISYESLDLKYIDGRPHSDLPVFLMCVDITTEPPGDGADVEFITNAGGSALAGGSGELGVAALHWLFEQYYLIYHKNGSAEQQWAFQYAVWEIGNDFDGAANSIDPALGESHPTLDTAFPGNPVFVDAYTDMYDGLVAIVPTLVTSYRSSSFTIDLFQNVDPSMQNMVVLIERAPSASAGLAVTKTGPASVALGANAVYTIVVTNSGPDSAFNTVVTDVTPPGLTFVSNAGSCETAYPCGIGTLANGASVTITTTYAVPTNYAGPIPIANTAGVTSDTPDPDPTNNSSTVTTPVDGRPAADLAVTKTGPANVATGSNAVYTVIVTNNGPDPAVNAVVTDPTPAGLTFVSNAGGCATVYPCSLGTLASGASVTITTTYVVPAGYTGPNPIENTATASSDTADPDPTNNSDTATTVLAGTPVADLAVTKTGPADVATGSNAVYTVVVTNNGPDPAVNTVVTDPTPAGLTFVSNAGGCTTVYPCSLGTLASGASVTITTTYAVPAGYTGPNPIENTARVSSDTADPDPANNSATATTPLAGTPVADLAVSKTGPANVAAGNNVIYTVVVTNNGPDPAVNTVLTDPTPAGLTFVSNAGGCTTAYPCSIGTLASGASVTITTTYAVPASYSGPNPIVNTARTSSDTPDPDPTNNSDTATTVLAGTPAADLAVSKTGPAIVAAGDNVVFTVVVTNNGPDAAVNTVVTDPTPAGLTFVSNAGGCATVYPCSLGTLASGASVTITTTYAVPAGYAGPSPIENTATASSDTVDPDPTNNSDTATILLAGTPMADLVVTKTGPGSAQEEQTISYTIRVVNQGPDAVPDAVLSDPTPPGLTYVSSTDPCASGFPCALPPLANGAAVTFTTTYTVRKGYTGVLTNVATATSPTIPDPVPSNNISTVTTSVGGDPGTPANPVPMDSRWMLTLIGLLLVLAGGYRVRSRQ